MEIPAFCTKAAPRVVRKRRTAEETDPDYDPIAIASKNAGVDGVEPRKRVRRSKTVENLRKVPPPPLNLIERPEYAIEDWKKKAVQVRKTRIRRVATEVADSLKDVDPKRLTTLEYPFKKIVPFGSENPYQRFVEPHRSDDIDNDHWNLDSHNLPTYVMGSGKGTVSGPPEFEFKSLWDYELLPLSKLDSYDSIREKLPNAQDLDSPNITPEILSIVACFSVGRDLNLSEIAYKSRNVEYNPDRFAPLIMRIRNPKSTGLIFGTGRIIVTGTRSEEECRKAARKYARVIERFGYNVRVINFEIQNISAACNLKFRVRLNQLSQNRLYGKLCYEPELFPGLIISLENPRVKVIIFCTGSVLMTGSKSVDDLKTALNKVYPLVRMYAP